MDLTQRKAGRTILSVQALRAFAATQVLAGHILLDVTHRYNVPTGSLTRLPWLSGVDVFFLISGFIMMRTSWDHFEERGYARAFMLNRIVRIVPMYLIFTTAMVVAVVAAPSVLGETKFDPAQILTSYLFIPYRRIAGEIQPVLAAGWTLNYEMFFYVLFSFVLVFRRSVAVVLMLASFIGLAILHGFVSAPAPILFWTDPIILEFAVGALVGYAYCTMRRSENVPLAIAAVLVSLTIFFVRPFVLGVFDLHPPRIVQDGGPALLLLVSCTLLMPDALDRRVPAWLSALGDSSYALYLSHPFGMRAAALLWAATAGKLQLGAAATFAYALVVFLMCVAGGEIVHRLLEKPMTRALARRIKRPVVAPLATRSVRTAAEFP